MSLLLTDLPASLQHYTGKPVPAWMRKLEPEAAEALLRLDAECGGLIYTDLWRSAEVSLLARKEKRGVQPPGWSGHNYGLSVDFTVDQIMAKKNWGYKYLCEIFISHGWYPHRKNLTRGFEEWHFDYLGPSSSYLRFTNTAIAKTWAAPVQKKVSDLYGQFLTVQDVPAALLELDEGSVRAFQTKWGLIADGVAGPQTQRLIGYLLLEQGLV